MTLQARGTLPFWLAVLFMLALVLGVLHDILLPFGAGLVLAFIMDPLADRLQRLGLSRALSVLAVFGALLFTITMVMLVLIPLLTQQMTQFMESLPSILSTLQNFANAKIEALRDALGPEMTNRLQALRSPFETIAQEVTKYTGTFIGSLWAGGAALFNVVSLLIVTPIVAGYLLYDWDRMVAIVDGLIPRRDLRSVRRIAAEINAILAAYLRGQALICLFLGLIYSLGLAALGLNFSLLIGLVSGMIAFIPFVGNIIGLGTALLVGFSQFGPQFGPLVSILAVFGIGQFIDGYVLQPRLLGPAVHLHPVWIFFAFYAFGSLFGFVGVILAVPLAASIGVLVRHTSHYYQHTQLYRAKNRTTTPARKTAGT